MVDNTVARIVRGCSDVGARAADVDDQIGAKRQHLITGTDTVFLIQSVVLTRCAAERHRRIVEGLRAFEIDGAVLAGEVHQPRRGPIQLRRRQAVRNIHV